MKGYFGFLVAIAGLVFVLTLVLSRSQAYAQKAGFYKAKVGNLEVTAISDATGEMGFGLLGELTNEQISLEAAKVGSGGQAFPSYVNAFVVDLPSGKALVDTGNGPQANLLKNLKEAGIDPADIKVILLTHFHMDHIGGLIDQSGNPAFPNAVVYADTKEDEYWLGGNDRGQQAQKSINPYKSSDRYKLFSPGDEVLPGVKAVELYGHTPGHVGFLFEGGDEDFLAWGDIIHIAYVQFKYPEATMQYDVDKPKARETRKKTLAESAENGQVVAGSHLPFPGIGRVSKTEGESFTFKPID
ncbi:MAG: MBL fold metallo-hydrolase [Deltaproteobacteria bacterium]|jgi:glyoxylase-like metal-dependent hydrolase (beta-lactamase superfamily II)|nr:MBL fold metallo-hydrolase [Deltaproteobacteria bacterium]